MIRIISVLSMLLLVTACGHNANTVGYDYTAFKNSQPKSILVLPPVNETLDVNATNGFYAQVTMPLAESGYYVIPVGLVNETLKQNGITVSEDAKQISLDKLHEVFGADAVLYLTVTDYGTSYKVVASDTRVTVSAVLVDSQTGVELWRGYATSSSTEGSSGGGIISMLISAAVNQIIDSVSEKAYTYAGITGARLLSAGRDKQILYGPRSPHYEP